MTNIKQTKTKIFVLTTNCMYQNVFDSTYCKDVTTIRLQIISKWIKSWNLFRRKYYWSNSRNHEQNMFVDMFEFVKEYIKNCAICKRSKTFRHKFFENFQFLFISQYKWSNFTMNFVTKLSTSKNWNEIKYDNIFVVVDRFTKMNHYVLIIKTIKVKNLTNVFIKKIIRYHEFFSSIIIDRDSLFTFEYYFFLCYVLKINKKRLQRFILELMNRRNVKTTFWNNVFEYMSISFKIIEFFYFS